MFNLYKQTHEHIQAVEPDSVFVEIGSAPFYSDGSSCYFADVAQEYNTILHTVDIRNDQPNKIDHSAIEWHAAFGSEWCENYSQLVGKKISCLYLDNFDYDWDVNQKSKHIEEQKQEYRDQYGIDMTNRACQIEHMKQMIALLPWMTDQCVISVDDTYLWNECWVGKCGPVVVYLQAQGFEIMAENTDPNTPGPRKYEVILRRNNVHL